MKNFKNQTVVITISVVIFISFLSLIYKSGNFDKDEEEEKAFIDVASQVNNKVEERKDGILEEKTEELANRIEDLLNLKKEEEQQVLVQQPVEQTPVQQPVYTQPVIEEPAPKPKTKVS